MLAWCELTALHQGLSKYLTAQDTHVIPALVFYTKYFSDANLAQVFQLLTTVLPLRIFSLIFPKIKNYINLRKPSATVLADQT